MEPPSELQQKYAAALAEQAALKRKLKALEDENAALATREAELERRLAESASEQATTAAGHHQATDIESGPLLRDIPTPATGTNPSGGSGSGPSDAR